MALECDDCGGDILTDDDIGFLMKDWHRGKCRLGVVFCTDCWADATDDAWPVLEEIADRAGEKLAEDGD